jgi:anaerobic selenocysteine-containing dehydrogenase
MNDRYRGITGRRDVVFVNEQDLARRGLSHGDLIDIVLDCPDSAPRALRRVTAVAYNIPQGSVAAYYPEANVLVSLDQHDLKSGTPAYKSIPIRIEASAA